jgi:hypothetical protein
MRYSIMLLCFALAACGAPSRGSLEAVLIQDGDLPAGYTAGQISDGLTMPGSLSGFDLRVMRTIEPPADMSIFEHYVVVALYSDTAAQGRDFDESLARLTAEGSPSSDVGDQARINGNVIMFLRCAALVQMQLGMPAETLVYAKRLDERLSRAVC